MPSDNVIHHNFRPHEDDDIQWLVNLVLPSKQTTDYEKYLAEISKPIRFNPDF